MSTRIAENITIYELESSGHRVDIEWTLSGQQNQEMSSVHSKKPAEYEFWDLVDCPLEIGGGRGGNNNVHSNTELDELPTTGKSLTLNEPISGTYKIEGTDVEIKKGDRVICYPNPDYFNRKKTVKATVLNIEVENGRFTGAEIKWKFYKKVEKKWVGESITSEIAGGYSDWILSKC